MQCLRSRKYKCSMDECTNYSIVDFDVAVLFVFLEGEEQGSKSPFSLLSEPTFYFLTTSIQLFPHPRPSSSILPTPNFSFSPSSLLFLPISPSSQLFLGHFSLLPILFLPPLPKWQLFLYTLLYPVWKFSSRQVHTNTKTQLWRRLNCDEEYIS